MLQEGSFFGSCVESCPVDLATRNARRRRRGRTPPAFHERSGSSGLGFSFREARSSRRKSDLLWRVASVSLAPERLWHGVCRLLLNRGSLPPLDFRSLKPETEGDSRSPTMPTIQTSQQVLDRHYLEIRCGLLDLAAAFDRLERCEMVLAGRGRSAMGKVHEALRILSSSGMIEPNGFSCS